MNANRKRLTELQQLLLSPLCMERWIINGRDTLVFRHASSNQNDRVKFMVGGEGELADADGNFFQNDLEITGYVDCEADLMLPANQRRRAQ